MHRRCTGVGKGSRVAKRSGDRMTAQRFSACHVTICGTNRTTWLKSAGEVICAGEVIWRAGRTPSPTTLAHAHPTAHTRTRDTPPPARAHPERVTSRLPHDAQSWWGGGGVSSRWAGLAPTPDPRAVLRTGCAPAVRQPHRAQRQPASGASPSAQGPGGVSPGPSARDATVHHAPRHTRPPGRRGRGLHTQRAPVLRSSSVRTRGRGPGRHAAATCALGLWR